MKSISACNHPNDRLTKSADRKWEVGFLIACIITDTIGLHEVLLAVNYNYENLRKKKEEKQPLVISFHKKKTAMNSANCTTTPALQTTMM